MTPLSTQTAQELGSAAILSYGRPHPGSERTQAILAAPLRAWGGCKETKNKTACLDLCWKAFPASWLIHQETNPTGGLVISQQNASAQPCAQSLGVELSSSQMKQREPIMEITISYQ